MRTDAFNAKADSVLIKQQGGEINASPVGGLTRGVELVVKKRVLHVLICFYYPSIDLEDGRMTHRCQSTS
jgi:hypothetical protein